jgi:hypothetical protein
MNRLFVGRELKMKELKERIRECGRFRPTVLESLTTIHRGKIILLKPYVTCVVDPDDC